MYIFLNFLFTLVWDGLERKSSSSVWRTKSKPHFIQNPGSCLSIWLVFIPSLITLSSFFVLLLVPNINLSPWQPRAIQVEQCPAQRHLSRASVCSCKSRYVFICLYLKHWAPSSSSYPLPLTSSSGLFPFPHNGNNPQHSSMPLTDGSLGNGMLRRFHHVSLATKDRMFGIDNKWGVTA